MPGKVLALFADHFTQPLLHFGVVHRVVIDPALVASVVGRINVDALHLALELGQQALQRLQVVTVDDAVIRTVGGGAGGSLKGVLLVEDPERHLVMVVDDLVLPYPGERWHVVRAFLCGAASAGYDTTASGPVAARRVLGILERVTNIMPDDRSSSINLFEHFYNGLWGSKIQQRLSVVGDELNKVRNYANERDTDSDVLSQSVVFLTLGAYYSGLVPTVRIESALFIAKDFRNEYAFALAARAYIEVAGRIHKGMRLWRRYEQGDCSVNDFNSGTRRLMANYQPAETSNSGIFKGKGFNIMTLIDSLEDKIPDIHTIYDHLSRYVHGDFEAQMMIRKISWVSELKQEENPLIAEFEKQIDGLRSVVFDDFEHLLAVTKVLRERYDQMHQDTP